MAGLLTDAGATYILGAAFGATSKLTSFTLQLCTIMTTISDADTTSTHTVIPNAEAGYADITLDNDATVSSVGGIPTLVWERQSFVFSGPLTTNPNVVGYQIKSGTTLIAVEKFDNVFTPELADDELKIIPTIRMGNGTPT
jgi:hypothetical protein